MVEEYDEGNHREQIINTLKSNSWYWYKSREIKEITGIYMMEIYKILNELHDEGLIEKRREGNGMRYRWDGYL